MLIINSTTSDHWVCMMGLSYGVVDLPV